MLDVGCGSGVLAIAAAKLGFAPVVAVDSAPEAVDATRRNAAANGVDIEVACVNALEEELPAAAVALANIELAAVQQLAHRLHAQRLISSGYLAIDEPELATWTRVGRRERDGWAADLFARAD